MPEALIHLQLQRFADLDAEARRRLLGHLTPADETSLVHHPESRTRQALARGLLRELLGTALQCAPTALDFRKTPYGKPYLADGPSFNLSHSQEAVVIAWSHAPLALGVDVEDTGRERQTELLARRKFSPAEIRLWQEAADPQQQWLAIWTRKEALLKAQGMGIRINLPSVDTASLPAGDFAHPVLGRWQWRSWASSGQVLSLAWTRDPQRRTEIALPPSKPLSLIER